jgi:hypothetical protein
LAVLASEKSAPLNTYPISHNHQRLLLLVCPNFLSLIFPQSFGSVFSSKEKRNAKGSFASTWGRLVNRRETLAAIVTYGDMVSKTRQ